MAEFTEEQRSELRNILISAIADAHICTKEQEIAQLAANYAHLESFAEEVKETNNKIVEAMSCLNVGAARLARIEADIHEIKEDNKEEHTELSQRISNIGKIVEHKHQPVIDEVIAFRKFARTAALSILVAGLLAFAGWSMSMFADHRTNTEPVKIIHPPAPKPNP
jgi:hypothetical protein